MNEDKQKKYRKITKPEKKESQKKQQHVSSIEKELINFCFTNNVNLRKIIKNHLNIDWLESRLIREIYKEIYMHLSSEEMAKPEIVMNELINEDARNLMAQLIFDDMNPTKNIIVDCLCRIEKNKLQQHINQLRLTLKDIDVSEAQKLKKLEALSKVQEQKNRLMDKYKDA